MKRLLRSVLLIVCCIAPAVSSLAADSAADEAWKKIETALSGPAKKPASREEAKQMYREFIEQVDKLSADFAKNFPKDPRRWKLVQVQTMQFDGMREAVGLTPRTTEETRKALTEITAASTADEETKAMAAAGLIQLTADELKTGQANIEQLEKQITAHHKAYPNFRGKVQLDDMLKRAMAQKELREKPLELQFTAVDGSTVDVSKMRGKVVLVDFWATWCGPCIAEIPNVVQTFEKLHPKGFEIIGISFDKDKDKLLATTTEQKMFWPQYFDGKGWDNVFGKKYGIASIPTMWLVNKEGMVVDTEARENLEQKVEKLLAE